MESSPVSRRLRLSLLNLSSGLDYRELKQGQWVYAVYFEGIAIWVWVGKLNLGGIYFD